MWALPRPRPCRPPAGGVALQAAPRGAAQWAETLPRCWRACVLEGRTGDRCWDCAGEEHEKATSGQGAPEPSPGRAPRGGRGQEHGGLDVDADQGYLPDAWPRAQVPLEPQEGGFGWQGFHFGSAERAAERGARPVAAHSLSPSHAALSVPSPSPSPATLTPFGLSSSAKCERSQPEGSGHGACGSSALELLPSPAPACQGQGSTVSWPRRPRGLPVTAHPPCRPSLPGWGGPHTRFSLVAPS